MGWAEILEKKDYEPIYVAIGDCVMHSMEDVGRENLMLAQIHKRYDESISGYLSGCYEEYHELGRRGQERAFDQMLRAMEHFKWIKFDGSYSITDEGFEADGRNAKRND